MAEAFSRAGVPVFVADVKNDLSGVAAIGNQPNSKRLDQLGLADFRLRSLPDGILGCTA